MRIESAIVCDDARKEEGGKHFLIGIYPHNILVSDFPVSVQLRLWVQFISDKKGLLELGVRVISENKDLIFSGLATVRILDHKIPATVAFPPMPIGLEKKDVISFQIREHKKRWKTAKSLIVGKQGEDN